jgi:hypothetical protein
MYDLYSSRRLAAFDLSGERFSDDAIPLATIIAD